MKLSRSILILFTIMTLGSCAFAQTCNINLTDSNMGTPSETYTVYIFLYNYTGIPVVVYQQQTSWPWYGSGTTQNVPVNYSMSKDDLSLYKYYVIVQKNTIPAKYADGWSFGTFDVTSYYSGINVPVSF